MCSEASLDYTIIFLFIVLLFSASLFLRKKRPEAIRDPQNNAMDWVITYGTAVVLSALIAEILVRWCDK